jgi:hypothetical protein
MTCWMHQRDHPIVGLAAALKSKQQSREEEESAALTGADPRSSDHFKDTNQSASASDSEDEGGSLAPGFERSSCG